MTFHCRAECPAHVERPCGQELPSAIVGFIISEQGNFYVTRAGAKIPVDVELSDIIIEFADLLHQDERHKKRIDVAESIIRLSESMVENKYQPTQAERERPFYHPFINRKRNGKKTKRR